jgi:hypothetical protein
MLNRVRHLRRKPAPPEPAPKEHPLDAALNRLGLPGAVARGFLHDFQELRPWWPIVIPLMIWVGMRTYRRERALVLAKRSSKASS